MRRWLFADQLGEHFLDDKHGLDDEQPVLLIESKAVFRRRVFHRQKAHLVLSALRHRAAELGARALLRQVETYRDGLPDEPLEVCHPTSRPAARLVRGLSTVHVLPPRGFCTDPRAFTEWADGRKALRLEDFYRHARRAHGVLMDGPEPAGGRWNYDHDNREPPPRRGLDVPAPPPIVEDEIDAEVRADLDRWEREGIRFVGADGPRLFPATAAEASARLRHFLVERLPLFGPYEDAMLARDPWMAHSMLSPAFNLGLLDPMDAVRAAEAAYRGGTAPLSSVEGFVRQLLGWRDYVWHLYWRFGPDYPRANALRATGRLPGWFAELRAGDVRAACLRDVLSGVRDRGWVHHIPRLMVLGNYGLQRGWHPGALADWFHRCFVDGYAWVMVTNVVGMSQYADGGAMTTKPYAAGGAYIDRMSDYCGGCGYNPKHRTGDDACPYTAGYWAFLARNAERLADNHRMRQPLRGLERLSDVDEVIARERTRRVP